MNGIGEKTKENTVNGMWEEEARNDTVNGIWEEEKNEMLCGECVTKIKKENIL